MFDYVMVRYGEIGTKGKNKKLFIKKLKESIKEKLSDLDDVVVYNRYERIYVKATNKEEVANRLKKTPGVHSFCFVVFAKSIEELEEKTLLLAKNKKEISTFKINTRRGDKTFFLRSMEVTVKIADNILKNTNLKVDVKKPDFKINIEIRSEGIYFYDEMISGLGGYPSGSIGRGLVLLSGGIDSPLAAYEMIRRGLSVSMIHFHSPPYTSLNSEKKVEDLISILNEYQVNITLYKLNFAKIQEEIYKKVDENYSITILRRLMYKAASIVAKNEGIKVLINGDNLGQVASQTIESLSVISKDLDILVLRPLISFDKNMIIERAKLINTYDVSIKPYPDCCNIFEPKNPIIKPKYAKVKELEAKIDVDLLINESIEKIEVISFKK